MCYKNVRKIILGLFCIPIMTLSAQEVGLRKGALEKMIEPKVSLDSSYISNANIVDSDGSVGVTKNTLKVNNAFAELSYSNWAFNWDNIDKLPFGNGVDNPIEQMHSFKVQGNLPYLINDQWFMVTSLSLSTTFEKEMKDSYAVGIFSFASYKVNQNHTLQMGVFANYHPISTLILPIVSYSYRARQNDGLQFVLGFPRIYAGYYLSDKILLRGGMNFSQSVIKLGDDNVMENSGYIESQDYMGSVGASYEFNAKFTLEANFLYSLKRDFIIYNSAGDKVKDYSIEASPGVKLRLNYIF